MNRIQKMLTQVSHSQLASLAITLVLGCLAVYQVAVMTWLLVPDDLPSAKWQPSVVKHASSTVNAIPSLDALSRLNLFGEVQKNTEPKRRQEVVEATRKTALKLTLTGLVASSDADKALAVIEYRGKQETYGLDDSIAGTQAVIEAVMVDRVVLDNRGVLENLFLEADSSASNRASSSRTTRTSTTKTTQKPDVQALIKDPGSLTDYIKISPVKRDGQLIGYRVKPGKDGSLFKSVGLKNNDIAVAIEGLDLTDSAQAMEAMQELPSLESATVTVERDGQLVEIYIELPTQE